MTSETLAALREQTRAVLIRYHLPGFPHVVRKLPGTQLNLHVRAGQKEFVLRRFNEYTEPAALRAQFLLASLLRRAGLAVGLPLKTKEDESFVVGAGGIWAVFPWMTGHGGKLEVEEDRARLVHQQGQWVAAAAKVETVPEWDLIVRTAKRFRQRKSWAWVVPLDRVPEFASERKVLENARLALRPEEREAALPILETLSTALAQLEQLIVRTGMRKLPHTVTHGDFVLGNVLISGRTTTVMDLDCYTYEPRAADFARTVSHWKRRISEAEVQTLGRVFQSRAQLAPEELECVPLLIAAYELYYAVLHVLLMLELEEAGERAKMLAAVEEEAGAIGRYHKEGGRWRL